MRTIAIIFTLLLLTACHQTSGNHDKTKLILRAELREIKRDLIREFRFFENGTIEETVIYSGAQEAKNNPLFTTKFYALNGLQQAALKKQIKELSSNSYQNQFPWREDFYQRGDVLKFEYAHSDGLPHTSYYYTGHEDSPEIFKSLLELIQSNSSELGLLSPN